MANQTYQLVVRTGPQPNQVFALELDAITIGRDPLSDFVIDDPEVSRHHAKLAREAGGYTLQDMGSTNGTFVDGERLTGAAISLKPGQVLMLGSNVTLVYQVIAEPDPMATIVAPAAELPVTPEEEPVIVEEAEIEEPIDEDVQLAAIDISEEEEVISELEEPELIEEVDEVIVDSSESEAFAEDSLEDEPEEELEIVDAATVLEVDEEVVDIGAAEAVTTANDEDYAATMIDAVPPAIQAELSKEKIAAETEGSEAVSEVIEPTWEVNESDIVEESPVAEKLDSVAEEVEQAVSQEDLVESPPPVAQVPHETDYSFKEDATFAEIPKQEEAQIIDSGEPLPSLEFETQPSSKESQIVGEEKKRSQNNRNRNIIIAIAAILLLICCCLMLLGLIGYLFIPTVNF